MRKRGVSSKWGKDSIDIVLEKCTVFGGAPMSEVEEAVGLKRSTLIPKIKELCASRGLSYRGLHTRESDGKLFMWDAREHARESTQGGKKEEQYDAYTPDYSKNRGEKYHLHVVFNGHLIWLAVNSFSKESAREWMEKQEGVSEVRKVLTREEFRNRKNKPSHRLEEIGRERYNIRR